MIEESKMGHIPLHSEFLQMLTESLDRYLRKKYHLDKRNESAYGGIGFDRNALSEFCQLGLIQGLTSASDDFGGQGNAIAGIFQTLGRALVVEPVLGNTLLVHALNSVNGGEYTSTISGLIDGHTSAAWAHREKMAGDPMDPLETICTKTAEGWICNGRKILIRQGFGANWFLLSARLTEGDPAPSSGAALFLVSANCPGLDIQNRPCTDGGMACDLSLNHIFLPDNSLISKSGAADKLISDLQAMEILALCAESLGLMRYSIDCTKEYLRTRQQFGQILGDFQVLQHRLADLELEAAQAAGNVHRAATLFHLKDDTREKITAAAKYTVGRVGKMIAESCIQMHGAIGMTWEAAISHYAKRLVMIDHECGDEAGSLSRYLELSNH